MKCYEAVRPESKWLSRRTRPGSLGGEFGESPILFTNTLGLYGFPKRVLGQKKKKECQDAISCSRFNIAFVNSKSSGTLRSAIISVILEPGRERDGRLQQL